MLSNKFIARSGRTTPAVGCELWTPHSQGDNPANCQIGTGPPVVTALGIAPCQISKAGFEGQNLTRFLPSRSSFEDNQDPNNLWLRDWDFLRRMRDTLKTIRVRFVLQLIRIELEL